jgi:hypothetical protein
VARIGGDEALPRNLGRFNRPRLDFSVLGPLQVREDSGPLDLPSPMERALPHGVERLAAAAATLALGAVISELRTEGG